MAEPQSRDDGDFEAWWYDYKIKQGLLSHVDRLKAHAKAAWTAAPRSERGERQAKVGDIFQIIEAHGRNGWIGAFVMATEIKSWGIQGFVPHVQTHDEQTRAYIRLKWEEIEFIGHAPLIPADESGERSGT